MVELCRWLYAQSRRHRPTETIAARDRGQTVFNLDPRGARCRARGIAPHPCQGWGRGFESLRPLQSFNCLAHQNLLPRPLARCQGSTGEAGESEFQRSSRRQNCCEAHMSASADLRGRRTGRLQSTARSKPWSNNISQTGDLALPVVYPIDAPFRFSDVAARGLPARR